LLIEKFDTAKWLRNKWGWNKREEWRRALKNRAAERYPKILGKKKAALSVRPHANNKS
jgi:hypothetical protein